MLNIPLAFLPQGNELIIILVLVLLFFGGAKIPQLMRGLGKGMGEFQEGVKEGRKKLEESMRDTPDDEESARRTS
jgi:sec-independent protein translocase protein TatA